MKYNPGQRFVSSIGKIDKLCDFSSVWADWAELGDTETAEQKLQTDDNFLSKGQVFISIFNNIPKLEKVEVTPCKTKKACWF